VQEGSRKAIIAAFFANLGIAIAKFVGFVLTGSAGLLAEAGHSVADTGNQGLLMLGSKRGKRPADRAHPFGYGPERYFWSFVVALVLFSMGGLFALYEGIAKLRHPHVVESPAIAYGILVIAIALETYSLRTAVKEANLVRGGRSWWRYIRTAKAPELPVVLLEDVADAAAVTIVAEKLIAALTANFVLAGREVHVTASIGISAFPEDGVDPVNLLKNADAAMYRAKEQGKNNYVYYSAQMNIHALERVEMESDLRHALRSLSRTKGLSLTVILTLALGIGANAAIFSVVRGVLLRPLVNRDEDRLLYIRQSGPGPGAENMTFSVPEINDLKSRVRTISAFGDFSTVDFTMIGLGGEPRMVKAGVVGGSFFDVMGLRPVLGRLLNAKDDGPKAAGAAVPPIPVGSGPSATAIR